MVTPDQLGRLKQLGIAEYPARAYTALLATGRAEAREVARVGKIPLGKVYRALEQLQERGLAAVIPEVPKKYEPIPIETFLARLRVEYESRIAQLAASSAELVALFPLKGDVRGDDRGRISVLKGRQGVLSRLAEMASSATRSLVFVGSEGFAAPKRSHFVAQWLPAAGAVSARVVIQSAGKGSVMTLDREAEVRVVPPRPGRASCMSLLVVDDREALLVQHVPDDDSVWTGEDVAIVTDNLAFVSLLSFFGEEEWRRGTTTARSPPGLARAVPVAAPRDREPKDGVGSAGERLMRFFEEEGLPPDARRLLEDALGEPRMGP